MEKPAEIAHEVQIRHRILERLYEYWRRQGHREDYEGMMLENLMQEIHAPFSLEELTRNLKLLKARRYIDLSSLHLGPGYVSGKGRITPKGILARIAPKGIELCEMVPDITITNKEQEIVGIAQLLTTARVPRHRTGYYLHDQALKYAQKTGAKYTIVSMPRITEVYKIGSAEPVVLKTSEVVGQYTDDDAEEMEHYRLGVLLNIWLVDLASGTYDIGNPVIRQLKEMGFLTDIRDCSIHREPRL
jgi:hypothetical protein